MALLDQKMTYDAIQAWEFGPVYVDLWEALKRYGVQPIRQKLTKSDKDPFSNSKKLAEGNFNESQNGLIKKVFDRFGQFEAFQLSALTHKKRTPWHTVYEKQQLRNGQIPDDLIKDYYLGISNKSKTG